MKSHVILSEKPSPIEEQTNLPYKVQEAEVNVKRLMEIVRKYAGFEELTPTLLRELVEKIEVHNVIIDKSGERHQEVDIYYRFAGKVEPLED